MQTTNRFLSLDVLRGLTVCFMIIVNTGGYGAHPFAPLVHAPWNGFTPTDLVFPSFLFVTGNAMIFFIDKYAEQSNAAFFRKVFKRTIIIFLLGFLMYWFPFYISDETGMHFIPFAHTRIPGVLQRIALCYCVASLLIRFLSQRMLIITCLLFLLGYWASLYIWGDASDPLSVQGNAVYRLDMFLLGPNHLYRNKFDPEGLLSTIPAVVNVIAGYFAGKYLKEKGLGFESIAKLLMAGGVLILAAIMWDAVWPVNKKLWTGSYVCLTIGLDLILLSFLIYIIDIEAYKKWTTFFIPFGKNPLFIYLLSELFVVVLRRIPLSTGTNLYQTVCSSLFSIISGGWGSLLFATSYMMICWLIAWLLYKRRIYIKV